MLRRFRTVMIHMTSFFTRGIGVIYVRSLSLGIIIFGVITLINAGKGISSSDAELQLGSSIQLISGLSICVSGALLLLTGVISMRTIDDSQIRRARIFLILFLYINQYLKYDRILLGGKYEENISNDYVNYRDVFLLRNNKS